MSHEFGDLESRFNYLKEMSTEELLEEIETLRINLETMMETLNDPDASDEQKSEFRNRDIPYNKDKIKYIQGLVESRYEAAMKIK